MNLRSARRPDFLTHLAAESARFLQALSPTPPDAPVPTCPGWTADDLLWHLGEVQWFWGTIVRDGLTGEQAEQRKPGRPAGRDALADFYRRSSGDLSLALAAAAPAQPAWTWSSDQSVGFVRRRQSHEALIHRIDAEVTAGNRTGMDPALSADGVDEVLRVMFAGLPGWATFTPEPDQTLRVTATDTADTWLVVLGTMTGSDGGTSYHEPCIAVADTDPGGEAAAIVSGAAHDLDCWLWGRPTTGQVTRTGDAGVLDDFGAIVADGIQ
ncbi:MAG: maleylpyruvate isomerase family mycothiol-dependent enzyme [Streptosporangiaceae bacterium]